MSYAVITINKETKRVVGARLYDAPKEGEFEVGYLPDGNVADYLYEDGKYIYFPNKDISKEELTQIKSQKLRDMSTICEQTIYQGIDVDLSTGVHHFSLTTNDQTNIDGIFNAVVLGASEYPYHADGEPCAMFSADDIMKLYVSAKTLITKETTYNNMLHQWIKREMDIDVLNSVTYGSDLPSDLNIQMQEVLGQASCQIKSIVSKLSNI